MGERMLRSKICLCLTAPTLEQDVKLVEKYKNWIDLVELRVDCLNQDQQLLIREFPKMIDLPAILTIRRKIDGGNYTQGEGARTVLFAKGLSFAALDPKKNFAYIDMEEDLSIPSLEEAARAFGTRIIRSVHNISAPITNIAELVKTIPHSADEICKIAFMPKTLSDVTNLYKEAKKIKNQDVILIAMGHFGVSTRILPSKLGSLLTFTSPKPEDLIFTNRELQDDSSLSEQSNNSLQKENDSSLQNKVQAIAAPGQLDPITLSEVYNFKSIGKDTKVFGVTGFPLAATKSPLIHNIGYREKGIDAVYIPIPAETPEEALNFANELEITGLSVTVPHKERILPYISQISEVAGEIGSTNTVIKQDDSWYGTNTDAAGFSKALIEFLGRKNLRFCKVAIIGAGGAAKAVANAIRELGGKACIFNRTVEKAKELALQYKFKWAELSPQNNYILEKYSNLIIQTTSIGMTPKEDADPIPFYTFKGTESLFDVIYEPAETKLMKRAKESGCKTTNGYRMLIHQGTLQFKLYTGVDYPPLEGLSI